MKWSKKLNNLRICPRRDSNTGGSDMWSNTLPLDHGGAPVQTSSLVRIIAKYLVWILHGSLLPCRNLDCSISSSIWCYLQIEQLLLYILQTLKSAWSTAFNLIIIIIATPAELSTTALWYRFLIEPKAKGAHPNQKTMSLCQHLSTSHCRDK